MKCLSLLRWLSVVPLLAAAAIAQDSKPACERAFAVVEQFKDKVYRTKVAPHWMPGGETFWYRNDLADGKREYVWVDAVKGERSVISEPPKSAAPTVLPVLAKINVSANGGEETDVTFINKTGAEVRLLWVGTDGKKTSYGSLRPDEQREQHTFAGHMWLAENAEGAPLGVWEAAEEAGTAIIESHPKFTDPDASAGSEAPALGYA